MPVRTSWLYRTRQAAIADVREYDGVLQLEVSALNAGLQDTAGLRKDSLQSVLNLLTTTFALYSTRNDCVLSPTQKYFFPQ